MTTTDLAPMPLTVYTCTHCTMVRKTQCSRVCRLDVDHPDTTSWDAHHEA